MPYRTGWKTNWVQLIW